MRFLRHIMVPLLWTFSIRYATATLPGIFILPFMSIPRKILSDAASAVVSTIITSPRPATTRPYFHNNGFLRQQQQNLNIPHQKLRSGVQVYKLIEQSPKSLLSLSSTTPFPLQVPGKVPSAVVPVTQKFVFSDNQVSALATNQVAPHFSTTQLHQQPQHQHYQPVPLTFPPIASPPSDSYQAVASHSRPFQPSPQISSHYSSTSSLSYSFQNGYNQELPKKLVKHVSVFVAPPTTNHYNSPNNRQRIQIAGMPEKHVNIIFIKGPDSNAGNFAEVNLPPPPEQKTFVYVLSKESNGDGQVVVNTPEPPKYNPPDVYFIKYKNKGQQQQKDEPNINPSPSYSQVTHYHQKVETATQQQQQQHVVPQTHYEGENAVLHNNPQPSHNVQPQQQQPLTTPTPTTIQQPPLDFLFPPPPPHPTAQQQQHPQNPPQQSNPELQHQSSSNQNFSYIYPSNKIGSSFSIIKRSSNVSNLPSRSNISQSAQHNFFHRTNNNQQQKFIAAERRMEQVGESHCSDKNYSSLFQSLGSSSEEDKSGNSSESSSQNINSNFFRNSEESKEDSVIKRTSYDKEHKRISSAISSIFITKKQAPINSGWSYSTSAVKYNVADRVLVVKNDSYDNTFPKEVEERDVGRQVKKYLKNEERMKTQGGNENVGLHIIGNPIKSYDDDHHASSTVKQSKTLIADVPVNSSTTFPTTVNNIKKVVDRSYQNGVGNGNSKIIPWSHHGLYLYQYAPTMGYDHFGSIANNTIS